MIMKFKLGLIVITANSVCTWCLQHTYFRFHNQVAKYWTLENGLFSSVKADDNDVKTVNIHSLDPQIYGGAFIDRVRELQAFKEMYGHCLVPKRFKSNPTLGNFVNKMRQQLRKYELGEKSSITPERIALLNHLGFRWDGRNNSESSCRSIHVKHDSLWMERFLELKENMSQVGGVVMPLGPWASKQRTERRRYDAGEKTSLTAERIQLLDSIKFCWDPREKVWNDRVQELINFKQEYGHCLVPTQWKHNRYLGSWVCTQRRLYKAFRQGSTNAYSEERIKQLTEIGFVWNRWEYELEKWQL